MTEAGHTRREILRSIVFFGLTCASSAWAYTAFEGATWGDGAIFSASLMSILLAHEMGHYVVARMHGFSLSLPIFIPFPSIFGTAGAVISLRSPPRSRQALLEMGAAGPIAGAVVSVMVLALSLDGLPSTPSIPPFTELTIFNDPLLVKGIGILVNGEVPNRYISYPPGAWAGWVGCFLTGMNLVPLGQLDGGHVLNALLGERLRYARWVVIAAMVGLGIAWPSWWFWLALLWLLGAMRPLPAPPGVLPVRARLIAFAILVLFVLTFLPIPFEAETFGPG